MPDRNELDRRDPVRASDRDRNKVAAELRTHCVEGRITLEELDERLDGVNAARTIRELAELVYDFAGERRAGRAAGARARGQSRSARQAAFHASCDGARAA